MKCKFCLDTGEVGQYAILDCAAPGCAAAADRARLNTAIASLPPMTAFDKNWFAYQQGRDDAEAVAAEQVKELRAMLSKMWGHAIELGETDYFDDPQFGKADWAADCAAAAKLIQSYSK